MKEGTRTIRGERVIPKRSSYENREVNNKVKSGLFCKVQRMQVQGNKNSRELGTRFLE